MMYVANNFKVTCMCIVAYGSIFFSNLTLLYIVKLF